MTIVMHDATAALSTEAKHARASGDLADISEGGLAVSLPAHPDAPAEGSPAQGTIKVSSSQSMDYSGTLVRVETDADRLILGVKFEHMIEIPGPILAVTMAEEY